MSGKYLKVKKTSTSVKRKRIGDETHTKACYDAVKYTLVSTTSINIYLKRKIKRYWVFESLICAKIGAFMFHSIQSDENEFRDKFFKKLTSEKKWT